MSDIDFSDLQGLVRFGYRHMTKAVYALLRIKDLAAARAWLQAAKVASAMVMKPRPKTALHIAFTASGLQALGVDQSIVEGFSHEFREGMTKDFRSRQLGDIEANDPQHWNWGGAKREPHVMVMFFGEKDCFDAFVESSKGAAWHAAFEELEPLDTSDMDDYEPFGFRDGISQPEIDWEQKKRTTHAQFDYTNVAALGEFVLGYPNEYGKVTDRPLLEANAASANLLPAVDAPDRRDLARNGTYLVMRQLEQDVRRFWQFVHTESNGSLAEAERLAAAMVGRTREGDPLVPVQKEVIPGVEQTPEQIRQNQFTFDSDPIGTRCPFGAHLRRANPRNSDYPNKPANLFKKLVTMLGFGPNGFRDDLMSSVRFHRIVRRGREYGPELKPEEALSPAPPNEQPRGLYFICLNANISRQFEFLQNAWIASTKFSGLTGESDPLLGNRQTIPGCPVTSGFTLPTEGALGRRITGLPQFVTLRGGAYFFLPSLRAIQYVAELSEQS